MMNSGGLSLRLLSQVTRRAIDKARGPRFFWTQAMSRVESIERDIQKLSDEELTDLR